MKANLYYHSVFGRTNAVKDAILIFFLALASWPRLLLEVFIRKNFGERYFSMATAIFIFIVLAGFPMFRGFAYNYGYGDTGVWSIIKQDPTWYLFLLAFLIVSIRRNQEIRREPLVFDFAKFSLSHGVINPLFYKVKLFGKAATPRTISTLLEPAFFFFIGGVLFFIFKQSVGALIMICSLCYSFGYYSSYHIGDEYVMDQIDQMICNEELMNSFVKEDAPELTRGFEFCGKRPSSHDLRRKLLNGTSYEEYDGAKIL